jgi:hypothetical protein
MNLRVGSVRMGSLHVIVRLGVAAPGCPFSVRFFLDGVSFQLVNTRATFGKSSIHRRPLSNTKARTNFQGEIGWFGHR